MTLPSDAAGDLPAYAGRWTLDPSHTSIEFHTKAMWVLPVKGTFKSIEGSGTVDANGRVIGSIVLDAASVDTKKKKRDDHLRTADFFEAGAFPTVAFAVTDAQPKGAGKVELTGDLTIHGSTRPLTVLADVSIDGGSATVSTEVDIDRGAWGLTWAKMGASLANHVVINARFTKV